MSEKYQPSGLEALPQQLAMTDTHRKILYVGGCADEVTEAVLHAAFLPFGNLETVQIPLDHKTQKNRGFGFVQYEERDDAAAALDNMHSASTG